MAGIRTSWLCLVVGMGLASMPACDRTEVASDPKAADETPAFVGEQACAGCHPTQYAQWSGSDHDLAMQGAGDSTVLGDFDSSEFAGHGVVSRFFKKDSRFFVNTEGADGNLSDFEIKYTFGVDPLQRYLIEFPGGRLQCLTIAWDTKARRWFDLYPDERIEHDDPLHWTKRYQNWNLMCADCHSTHVRKNYDASTDTYQTTWDGIDVGCQACHGPGSAHVNWAQSCEDEAVASASASHSGDGLVAGFTTANPRPEVERCAPCHSRRVRISDEGARGGSFLDRFRPELLREGLYHADGQILDEVYVYGSFVQSKMYDAGVRCADCHNPHSLAPVASGNALCKRCHSATPNPRFPTLTARDYDSPEHHFHKVGSTGARCINCHMPERTYMVVDPRRDHSFRVPRPDLSVTFATPNACNDCHSDESAEWAAKFVSKWYGPGVTKRTHFAEAFSAGRSGAPRAEPMLVAIAGDSQQPTIVRSTALELLSRYDGDPSGTVVSATHDADPLVRATAVGGLGDLPPSSRLVAAGYLLSDSVRAVRIEAARVLSSVPRDAFDPGQRAAFDAALAEFETAQRVMADMPAAHFNLGVVYAGLGRTDSAIESYETAIRMHPGFLPACFNLANLYNELGRNGDAERVLRGSIEQAPEAGEVHYSLGLVLAEEERLEEALTHLGEAVARLPDRARVRYNYALALQHLGRSDEAEAAQLDAHRIDPRDPAIVNALVVLYVQQEQWDRALRYARELVTLVPNAPGPRRLLEQIEARRARNFDER